MGFLVTNYIRLIPKPFATYNAKELLEKDLIFAYENAYFKAGGFEISEREKGIIDIVVYSVKYYAQIDLTDSARNDIYKEVYDNYRVFEILAQTGGTLDFLSEVIFSTEDNCADYTSFEKAQYAFDKVLIEADFSDTKFDFSELKKIGINVDENKLEIDIDGLMYCDSNIDIYYNKDLTGLIDGGDVQKTDFESLNKFLDYFHIVKDVANGDKIDCITFLNGSRVLRKMGQQAFGRTWERAAFFDRDLWDVLVNDLYKQAINDYRKG